MRPRGLKSLQAEDGASMVEFSLIAVMFIIVLLGVVDMGRMALVYTTLAQ
jgi:Flp pilus assembly protein TadG